MVSNRYYRTLVPWVQLTQTLLTPPLLAVGPWGSPSHAPGLFPHLQNEVVTWFLRLRLVLNWRQEAIQMIRLHQGSTSTPRGRSYTTAPRDRTGDPRLVQGHRHALIRVGLGRPQLLPNRPKLQEPHDSGLAPPKQAEDDLQRAKSQLQARSQLQLFCLLVTSLQRAEALRKVEVQRGKKAKRRDKSTEHRFACLFSVFPQENTNSYELEPYLPCATTTSLGRAERPAHCMPLIHTCWMNQTAWNANG